MIALQTNYYDPMNLYLRLGSKHWDIAGQLAWFEDVLSQIAALGEKAIIMAHEKPGSLTEGIWAIKIVSLLDKYRDNIQALYFGHNHNDMFHIIRRRDEQSSPTGLSADEEIRLYEREFAAHNTIRRTSDFLSRVDKTNDMLSVSLATLSTVVRAQNAQAEAKQALADIARARAIGAKRVRVRLEKLRSVNSFSKTSDFTFYNLVASKELGQGVGVILIPSSLTPNDYETNPSFRIMTHEAKTFAPIEYQQYRFDLQKGKATGAIVWENVYTARQYFAMKDLSVSQWASVAANIGGRKIAWERFKDAFHGGLYSPKSEETVVDKGQKEAMCFLATGLKDEYDICLEIANML